MEHICKKSIKLIVIEILNKSAIKNVLKRVIKDLAKMLFFYEKTKAYI